MNSIDLLNLLDTLSVYRRIIIRSLDTSSLQLPINATQEKVLMTILKIPEPNMKELSSRVGLEKSSLTRVIDSLIDDGLVLRSYSVKDRRIINCVLTKKGLDLANKIDRLMNEHIDRLFSDLSQEEKSTLFDNLSHASNTISKYL